jgi:hypothetical protein
MLHSDEVLAVGFTTDGRFAITGCRGSDRGPNFWDVKTGTRIAPKWKRPTDLRKSAPQIQGLALANDGHRVAVAVAPHAMELIDLDAVLKDSDQSLESLVCLSEWASAHRVEKGQINALTKQQLSDRWTRLQEGGTEAMLRDDDRVVPRPVVSRRVGLPKRQTDTQEAIANVKVVPGQSSGDPLPPSTANSLPSSHEILTAVAEHVKTGQWELAALEAEKLTRRHPRQRSHWVRLAAILALEGNIDAYKVVYQAAQARLAPDREYGNEVTLCRLGYLLPGVVNVPDQLLDRLRNPPSGNWDSTGSWRLSTLALVAFRDQLFDQAVGLCDQAMAYRQTDVQQD